MSLARAKLPGMYFGDGRGEAVGSGEFTGTLTPLVGENIRPGRGEVGETLEP